MYQSPIKVIREFVDEISQETENTILITVKQYVNVDKEELIKALEYDRDQYEKGFRDGWLAHQEQQYILDCRPLNATEEKRFLFEELNK